MTNPPDLNALAGQLQTAGATNKRTAQQLQEFNTNRARSNLSQRLQVAAEGIRSMPGQLSNTNADNSSKFAATLPGLADQISEFSQRLQTLSTSSTTANPPSSTSRSQHSSQSAADVTKLAALSQEIIQQSQNLAQRVGQFTDNTSNGSS